MNRSKGSIAVFGRDGRLGAALQQGDRSKGHCQFFGRDNVDFRDSLALETFCKAGDWDTVVLASAITNVDSCESDPEAAWLVNARAPEVIAHSVPSGTRVVLISTDFVFDGRQRIPYEEDAVPNPLSVYGQTKLAAEKAVLAASSRNLVIRSSWLFGGGKPSLPDIMIERACKQRVMEVVADRWASPTSAEGLALAVLEISKCPQVSGMLHYCNSGICNPFEYVAWALECARACGRPLVVESLLPIRATQSGVFTAQRPPYSALSTSKYQQFTGQTQKTWQEALREHIAGQASAECLADDTGVSRRA